jgi:maltose/moltooligosaccharide transporter
MTTPFDWLLDFVRRQTRNYRVLLVRKLGYNLFGRLSNQYTSLYAVALGVDMIGLGTLNSVGSAVSTILSLPVGRLVDRYSLRKMMLFAMILEILVPFAYVFAWNWVLLIPALIFFQLTGFRSIAVAVENVYIASSVKNQDRASGFGVATVLATIGGTLAPIIAAYLVIAFGGINATGIRPLFIIQLAGLIPLAIAIFLNLAEISKPRLGAREGTNNFLKDFRSLFKNAKGLKRFIFMESLGDFSMGMVFPFAMVFAVEGKNADPLILGYMGMAATLSNMIFAIPIGRLADRIGRKKTLTLMRPIMYASYLLIAFAPGAYWLVLAWAFLGFPWEWIVWSAMSMEMVPEDQRGRWSGMLMLFDNVVRIPAPIIGGIIYETVGPTVLFLLPVGIDLFLRLPVLLMTHETLWRS